ncbi:MAG: recombinase [Microbacterium sp.]|uniref:recombinase family protein n=1 Tax=Microbacterium sp. TaxID=51671 RepID=UPI0029DFB963|nr:recombinase [Microbacterium sp.]
MGRRRAVTSLREIGALDSTTDPIGRLLFNVLAMVSEFERDLISMRAGTDGSRWSAGHLKRKQPKLSATQRKLL